jgi:basic membrane protein A
VLAIGSMLLAGSLVLTACGDGDDSGSSPSPSSDIKVGLAYDIGGRGDQSFNDAAAAGLDKAAAELGVQVKELSAAANETAAQKEERLRLLAQSGYDPVIAIGFAYAEAVGKVAKEFPDTSFAIVDDASPASTAANIANLTFAENEGSYLVGVVAAQATKSKNVGFVGGVDTPLIEKFQAGFQAGVASIDPGIKVQVKYLTQPPDFSGFTDPAKGKTAAQGMFDAGADVVYHAAGGSGKGVFEAAQAAGGLGIGVDSDQYNQPSLAAVKDVIITSMLKRVDVAVFNMIQSCVDGTCLTGPQVFDLAKDGVGYSTSNPAVDPYKAKTDEAAQAIIDGSITVPETPTS